MLFCKSELLIHSFSYKKRAIRWKTKEQMPNPDKYRIYIDFLNLSFCNSSIMVFNPEQLKGRITISLIWTLFFSVMPSAVQKTQLIIKECNRKCSYSIHLYHCSNSIYFMSMRVKGLNKTNLDTCQVLLKCLSNLSVLNFSLQKHLTLKAR